MSVTHIFTQTELATLGPGLNKTTTTHFVSRLPRNTIKPIINTTCMSLSLIKSTYTDRIDLEGQFEREITFHDLTECGRLFTFRSQRLSVSLSVQNLLVI